MKQVYFIIAMLCGLALGGQAQGIRFAEGSWKELLETAKKGRKIDLCGLLYGMVPAL